MIMFSLADVLILRVVIEWANPCGWPGQSFFLSLFAALILGGIGSVAILISFIRCRIAKDFLFSGTVAATVFWLMIIGSILVLVARTR